jgi:hypothetical protein
VNGDRAPQLKAIYYAVNLTMTKRQKEYRQALLRDTPYQRPATKTKDISKEMIVALIENNDEVDFAPFGSGTRPEAIAKAEKYLGVTFPPSYAWWLRNYAGGEVRGREVYSVYEDFYDRGPDNVIAYPGDISFVAETNRRHGLFRDELEIMSIDGDETYYFDPAQRSEDGEWPIYLIEAGSDEPELQARNFLEFLYKIIS